MPDMSEMLGRAIQWPDQGPWGGSAPGDHKGRDRKKDKAKAKQKRKNRKKR